MNTKPTKIYDISCEKFYAYMKGVITIYRKYPQITPKISEQVEIDISDILSELSHDEWYMLLTENQNPDDVMYRIDGRFYTSEQLSCRILNDLY